MSGDVTRASAPGKLFLFGEYAVLAGGWSVLTAVDRRVHASVDPTGADYGVVGPDLEWDERLPSAVVDVVRDQIGFDIEVGQLSTDVAACYRGDSKLGLGSSAASIVSMISAILSHYGPTPTVDRKEVFSLGFEAHRQFQRGHGSCADIATSTFGGFTGYRLESPDTRLPSLTDTTPHDDLADVTEAHVLDDLSLPDDLEIRGIWLGEPAKSVRFIRKLADATRHDPDATRSRLRPLADLAHEAISALRMGDTGELMGLVERADLALERLGDHIEAPIVIDKHRRLRDVASDYGLATKPSGAGGGDFSLVFGEKLADWDAFDHALPDDIVPVDLTFGADGARVE